MEITDKVKEEQRIQRAADKYIELKKLDYAHPKIIAEQMLEAADHEPPAWPSDEFIKSLFNLVGWKAEEYTIGEDMRRKVRELLIGLDIVKEAIDYVNGGRDGNFSFGAGSHTASRLLTKAVKEAGL